MGGALRISTVEIYVVQVNWLGAIHLVEQEILLDIWVVLL